MDVPTADLSKYENKAGAATGAEFTVPTEVAKSAKVARAPEPGSPEAPVKVKTADDLRAAEARVEEPRSQAAADAGEYKKAHVEVQGIDVEIETPKGAVRKKRDASGKIIWTVPKMPASYGAIRGVRQKDGSLKPVIGADGDKLDVYVGDFPQVRKAYVIDQLNAETGAFDELKVALAIPNAIAVKAIYKRAFSDEKGEKRFGGITEMTIPEFERWLETGDHTKPMSGAPAVAEKPSPPVTQTTPPKVTGQKPQEPAKSKLRQPTRLPGAEGERLAEKAKARIAELEAEAAKKRAPNLPSIAAEKAMATEMGRPYTDWIAKIEDIDQRGEPDSAYRAILSAGAKETRADGRPKDAETWREKVLQGIRTSHAMKRASAPEAPAAPPAQPAAPAAQAPKRAPGRRTQNLIQFLKANGGIKSSRDDLRALYPDLVNDRTGRPLDDARLIAAEAGYLGGNTADAMANTTINDLLDALRDGRNRFPQTAVDVDRRAETESAKKATKREEQARHEIESAFADGDVPSDPDFIDRVLRIYLATGVDPEVAIDRAIGEIEREELTPAQIKRLAAELPPGWDDDLAEPAEPLEGRERTPEDVEGAGEPAERRAVEEARPAAPERRPPEVEATEASRFAQDLKETRIVGTPAVVGPDGRAYRVKRELDGYIAMRMPPAGSLSGEPPVYFRPTKGSFWTLDEAVARAVSEATMERGADNRPQTVLPGAERISDAALAQRRADQPLRPRAAQKPMDEGLFGDESKQTDLLDLVRGQTLGATAERFEAGKALTKEQRKQVLGTLVDVYKANHLQKEVVGVGRDGNEIWRYPHSPDLFVKSDITGAMVRYYVRMPDGKIAHPTELFPDYKQSDIDREMQRRAHAAKQLRRSVEDRTSKDIQFDTVAEAAKYWDEKSEASKKESAGGWPLYAPASGRSAFTKDGKVVLISKQYLDLGDFVETLAESGWKPVESQTLASTAQRAAPVFYSAVVRAVETAKITKGTPAQWAATIRNTPGVKQEELDWIGLDDWLKVQTGSVTKGQVAVFVQANQIEVKDVLKGRRTWEVMKNGRAVAEMESEGAADDRAQEIGGYIRPGSGHEGEGVRHADWQLSGGENYRELLLTLPERRPDGPRTFKEWADASGREDNADSRTAYRQWMSENADIVDNSQTYRSSHFDEANIVAHIRFNDRTDAAGKRTLFIEEVQSDWHQAGRKKGYVRPLTQEDFTVLEPKPGQRFRVSSSSTNAHEFSIPTRWLNKEDANIHSAEDFIDYLIRTEERTKGVPDAPFKTTWPELALKRMIRWAAENGYDQVAWTPGDVQNVRYESALRQQVRAIEWSTTPPTAVDTALKEVTVEPKGSREPIFLTLNERGVVVRGGNAAPEAVGQTIEDLVGKEIATRILNEPRGKVEGEGLMIGGEGMRGFYDRILVNTANRLGKKFGAKVGQAQIDAVRRDAMGRAAGEQMRSARKFPVHSLPITPEMRESVLQGQTLFSTAQRGTREWYVENLTANRFDEAQFAALFRALQEDKALSHGDLTKVAVEFSGRTASRVKSRTDALKAIWSRHQDILVLRAKAAATGGRVAGETAQRERVAPRVKLDPRQVANLERTLTNIVHQVFGKREGDEIVLKPRMAWSETETGEEYQAGVDRFRAAGGLAAATGTMGGEISWYRDGSVLIRLATQDPAFSPRDSAYHEAYHGVEGLLMTDAELSAVKAPSEMAGARELAAEALGISGRAAAALPGYEARAIAFAEYARRREAGEAIRAIIPGSPILSRFFERLRNLLARIRRMLTNKGFTRWEDIFEDVYQGRMADRPRAYRDIAALASTAGRIPYNPAVRVDGRLYRGSNHGDALERATRALREPIDEVANRAEDGFVDDDGEFITRSEAYRREDITLGSTLGDTANRLDPFDEGGAEARRQAVPKAIEIMPLARALRLPFDLFGGLNEKGEWDPGLRLWNKNSYQATGAMYGAGLGYGVAGPLGAPVGAAIGGGAGALLNARFDNNGRFRFLNPMLEHARMGLVNHYGLDEEYVARVRGVGREKVARAGELEDIMQAFERNGIGPEEAALMGAMFTGEVLPDAKWKHIFEPLRESVTQQGADYVEYGLLDPEVYERWKATYAHRTYLPKELEAQQDTLARWSERRQTARRRRLIGEELKGKGLWKEVPLNALEIEGAERPAKGTMIELFDRMTGKRVDQRAWRPAGSRPQGPGDWVSRGQFEIRGYKGKDAIIWRDWTKEERVRMGEIMDIRYTIAKQWLLVSHDLATGHFYSDIASHPDWVLAPEDDPGEEGVDWATAEKYGRMWADPSIEWVKVPNTKIEKSGTRKWGKLSGRFVRAEIWRDLNETEMLNNPSFWSKYILRPWKIGKTALSPVTHTNNIISNFWFMDMAGVGVSDLYKGIRSIYSGDAEYEDAKRHGAFGVSMIDQEIRRDILEPLLAELAAAGPTGGPALPTRFNFAHKMSGFIWGGIKKGGKYAMKAYQVEDEIFRMAVYHKRLAQGVSPEEAADEARKQFVDYDIKAPWINAARNTVLPFIAYPYGATPNIARMVLTRPYQLIKYAALMYGLQMLAFAAFPGDEDKEKKALPEEQQGLTWVGAPRMLRMPFGDDFGNPYYLDIRRWIPSGDIFDTSQGQLSIPAPLQMGGPIMMGFELALNKQAFTGDEIVNKITDNWWEQAQGYAGYAWRSAMPNAAFVPGSWAWQKIDRAISGATTFGGRPYGLPEAVASAVGVKVAPLDVEESMRIKGIQFGTVERELSRQMGAAKRARSRGMISQSEFDAEIARLRGKKKVAADKWRELNR